MTPTELGILFLNHYPVDENGYSDVALVDDLVNIDPDFRTTNGCQWARTDSSWLGKRYLIKRERKGTRTFSVQLVGFNTTQVDRTIPAFVYRDIEKRCVILDITSQIEIDHKDGRYEAAANTLDQFQGLAKTANDAKRQHCKECKNTNIRFDARVLGSKIPYISGDEKSESCLGCYWHDPIAFWKEATKNY